MKIQRLQAYATLIEELLDCPSGEEGALLQDNRALIDADLLRVVAQFSAQAQAQGNEKMVESLREVSSLIQTQIDSLRVESEERSEAYLTLIEQLLDAPSAEAFQILAENPYSTDSGFLQACEAVAEICAQDGDEKTAEFLRQVAVHLKYEPFVRALWEAEYEHGGKAYPVFTILDKNVDKLDEGLALFFRGWADASFQSNALTETRELMGSLIGMVCTHIQEYPLRNRSDKIEIVIAGYEFVLRMFEVQPELRAHTQHNLGSAYRERFKGEKADNLENAIAFYRAALEVYTRDAFPQNHAETLFNLGLACRDARRLSDARDAFAAAIETVEFLGGEIASDDETKQKFAKTWRKLYQNMVEVCREMGDEAEAKEYLERGNSYL